MENTVKIQSMEEVAAGLRSAAPAQEQPVVQEPEAQVLPEAQTEPQLDYAALYEEEKTRREKAEFTLYRKNKAERQAKKQEPVAVVPTSDPTGFVDHEAVEKDVESKVLSMLEAQRQKDAEDILEEELMSLTSNPDERRLIRLKYDNAIQKTGYSRLAIRQDLADAHFLANKPKYIKEKTELVQAAVSKKTTSNAGVAPSVVTKEVNGVNDIMKNFSEADQRFMKEMKWDENKIRKAAEALPTFKR